MNTRTELVLVSGEFISKFEVVLKPLSEVVFARLKSSMMEALRSQAQISETYMWFGTARQQSAGSRARENGGSLSSIMSTKSHY